MTKKNSESVQNEIWQLVDKINNSWIYNKIDDLNNLFHKDIVMLQPNLNRIKGKDIIIKSYKDFVENSVIIDFKVAKKDVHLSGNTAVAAYDFIIEYKIKHDVFKEAGQEIFVFSFEEDKWQAIWRMISFKPKVN